MVAVFTTTCAINAYHHKAVDPFVVMLMIFFMLEMNNLMQLWISLDYVFFCWKNLGEIF
jgi:hypothetical protein